MEKMPIESVLARFAALMTEYDKTPWYRFRRRWALQDEVFECLVEMIPYPVIGALEK